MSQPTVSRKSMEAVAEEIVARYRRGERPSMVEYTAAYPDLADEIRQLFPTLVLMEELAPSISESSRPGSKLLADPSHLGLGDYRILREIGRGGMGIVYEAEQLSLGRHVALKVLHRHAASELDLRQRFHREARAAAQLHHTNIVPVFEVGEDEETCWYAMQLILGQGLDQVIEELRKQRQLSSEEKQGRPGEPAVAADRGGIDRSELSSVTQAFLSGEFVSPNLDASLHYSASGGEPVAAPTERASLNTTETIPLSSSSERLQAETSVEIYFRSVARIGRQAAEALAHAHARGIIHRDIKPSNLLLDTAGVVWITDFGLAKTQDNSLTRTGDVVGTLRYMPRERFQGEGDRRVDIYGLGLTLYELLALRPAYDAKDRLVLIDQIKNREPPRPRSVDRRIPRDLETIVLKASAREVKQRYPSAEELAEDLRRFLAYEPIKARRTSELKRLLMWGRRNPAVAVLSVCLFLLLNLVAGGATVAAFYLLATLEQSEHNRDRAEQAVLDGRHKMWLSYVSQAQARRLSRQSGQRFASLRAIREALSLPVPPGHSHDELRTEAIAALCLPDLELDREGGREVLGAEGFAIDPAFERYAIADKDGNVTLYRLADDQELLRLPGAGLVTPYRGLQFSPDGRFLDQRGQGQGGCRSRLWDLAAPRPRAVLDDNHITLTFRPDGHQCAASYPDRTIRVFDSQSGRELHRWLLADMPPGVALHWNPRLPQLLLYGVPLLRVLNVETGKVVTEDLKIVSGINWVDWHPEGQMFAVSIQRKIILWDVAGRRPILPPLEGHKASGVVLAFNHAGDRLLSTDWTAGWHLWDSRTGRLLLTVPAGGTMLYFRGDTRQVGSGGGGKVQLYHLRHGEELRTVCPRSARGKRDIATECGAIIDGDGRVCALSTNNNAEGIPLVDVARGEEVALLPLPGNAALRFDREGALWTSGSAGLLRWPVVTDLERRQRRYGPPQRIFTPTNREASGNDGLTIFAIPNGPGAVIRHRDDGGVLHLGPQEDVRFTAVSPDGRWVATGSHWLHDGSGVKVWDARTGRHVKDFPSSSRVRFSPDGKWLLTTGGGCRLWSVGSWEEGPRLAASPLNPSGTFSRDGKLLALGEASGVIRLVVPDTGAEIARLSIQDQTRLVPGCFTPDGRHLIAGGMETGAVYIFNLTALRLQLAEMDLDWDGPPLPAVGTGSATSSSVPAPLSIDFDLGDLRR